ncbi:MAG: KTSC domain-containing protein [Treponema sp.]|jgi:hypothetical protein|nr:KTSC domain-containing protein [Treponema sp.]
MAKSYADKNYAERYAEGIKKSPQSSRYRNQGYNHTDPYTADQRKESYDKWKLKPKPYDGGPQSTQHGRVSSSWLTHLGYNNHTGEAEAKFKGTNAIFYYKMPYETFLEWLNSPSKGKWLHESGYMPFPMYRQQGGTPAQHRTDAAAQRARKRAAKYR